MTLSPILVLFLDVLGITLAVLDFTGTARKAEERLRYITKRQKKRAKIYRRWMFNITGTSGFWRSLLDFTIEVGVMLAFALLVIHIFDWWPGFRVLLGYLPAIPEPRALMYGLLILFAPMIWIGIFVINKVIGGVLIVGGLVIFHRFMWLLSRPKAGILGTLGLLLPITTATLNTLSLT